ncbi:E3 ubiquitin-protein ligase [Podosphaera aphanis]|nr:E3 ubiquitin-protein ligase [Podosphaera aphanis]
MAIIIDSDDEYMSEVSSDDCYVLEDESDDGSADEFGFDEPEPDLSDSPKDEIVQKEKKIFDTSFKVYQPKDIQAQQNELIDEVNMILDLRKEEAAILLRHFRWNQERLIEDYMDRPKKVLEDAGLGLSTSTPPRLGIVPGFMCDICCEDGADLKTFAMKCDHRYCVDCYSHYLSQKIKEGEAARIQCPQDGCRQIIDTKSLGILLNTELQARYNELLNRSYVEDKEKLKWCPAPDCVNAIECGVKKKDLDKVVPTVICECTYRFCFGCGYADHQPAPCGLVKGWLKKCADDSETANWISANTKECPKCNSTIEKNGGCNHMTCRKCKHEFCWMCMGLWSEHGTSWYNCNRFEEKSGADARDAQTKSRVSLERYLHYYNRYANHEQSAKLDKDILYKTEMKMVQLQSASGMSWIEVQYLNTASHALQTCRQTLKWTYAFAFYLARNNMTEMFEDNQKDLELAVEALSEMFEKTIAELSDPKLKVEIMDKTSYCNKRRIILLADTANGLANGAWDFSLSFSSTDSGFSR